MLRFSQLLHRSRTLALALLASAFACSAFAQTDPPGRIGRIAWLSGNVFLGHSETGERSAVPLNQPLTSGDVITTQSGARAEIQIGAATIRIDANSQLAFERIDDEQILITLDGGRIIAQLPTEDVQNDFVLETEQGRFVPRKTGIYHFDRDAEKTSATSYFGTLRFEGRDTALDVIAGERVNVWLNNTGQLHYQMAQGARDEFTQWSAARDQNQQASVSSRYVSPEMTGVQDLDTYGDWSEQPEYGAVWFPRTVAADWAPYRTGNWTWREPWGWSWVGYEPWGFAPFHYGRWARIHDRWGWIPGTRIARPVYAPALVAWSSASGVSASVHIGTTRPVGWFPLAPREVYVPYYRSSRNHVRFVNAPHVSHIRDLDEIIIRPHEVVRRAHFGYRNDPRAFSTTSAETFRRQRHETRMDSRPGEFRDFRDRPQRAESRPPEAYRGRGSRADAPPPERQPFPEQAAQVAPHRERPDPGSFRRSHDRGEAPVSRRQDPASWQQEMLSRENRAEHVSRGENPYPGRTGRTPELHREAWPEVSYNTRDEVRAQASFGNRERRRNDGRDTDRRRGEQNR